MGIFYSILLPTPYRRVVVFIVSQPTIQPSMEYGLRKRINERLAACLIGVLASWTGQRTRHHEESDDMRRMSWSFCAAPFHVARSFFVAAAADHSLWFIQIRILYWIIIIKILMIKVGLWFIYAMQWIIIRHRPTVLLPLRASPWQYTAPIYCPCSSLLAAAFGH